MSVAPSRQDGEPLLRIMPFVVGAKTAQRVIVRREDKASYLDLTAGELEAVRSLRATPISVSEYLGRHLAGATNDGLDLRGAVSLIMRLHHGGFIADTSAEISNRLREYAGKGSGRTSRLSRLQRAMVTALDLPLVIFEQASMHPLFVALGRLLVSWPSILLAAVTFVALVIVTGVTLPRENVYVDHFGEPEILLVKAFFAFSFAAGWLAFWQMAALAGAGARFVSGSVRLTGFSIVRLAVDDTDALMIERSHMLRYHAFTLISPWISALLAWQLVPQGEFTSLAGLLAGTFSLLGLTMLCPLYRSPLVKVAEALLATLNVLERANAYLSGGLFKFKSEASDTADRTAQLCMTAFASITLLWLYGFSLTLVDALTSSVPDLVVQVQQILKAPARGASALVILTLLTFGLLASVLRLALIPFQNLAAAARLPLKRARRGIDQFYDKSLSASDAVVGFLKEIPILAHLSDDERRALAAVLKYRPVPAGGRVITVGEPGDEFFILADGQAQVVLGGDGKPEEVVDVLSPGDSFGEIALVEKVKRTATIRALTNVKTLVLGRQAFDRLFPEGSEARARLTSTIRQVKLVLESSALSHLTPRQIRELLRSFRPAKFAAGDYLIREDTTGDAAYLIEAGEVQVLREGKELAKLGRGELVGTISLLKDVRRTASVRAQSEVSCLVLDKPTFLKMCMSNVFVALLISDLAERQLHGKSPEPTTNKAG